MEKRLNEAKLKHQSRKYCISEGIFATAKSHVGDNYIQAFAVALNASNSLVAILGSIVGLIWPFGQLFGSRMMEKYSRKKIMLKSILIRTFFWLSLIILGILFYKNIWTAALPIALLILYSFYNLISGISHPAWFSWTGDIVDKNKRGSWLSKRNLLMGFVGMIVLIISALLLNVFKTKGITILGFSLLFFLAFTFRWVAYFFTKKQYEPKYNSKKEDYFSIWQFLKYASKNNFGKFTIYRALIGFSSSIYGCLVAVYLLREIQLSYTYYILIVYGAGIFSFFVIELWGKIADKFGSYKVLGLSSLLVPIVPILWIANPNPLYLFLVPSMINHVAWAGFNLSTNNFIYDSVSETKRGLAVSYFNIIKGIGVFFGGLVGAALIKFWNIKLIHPIFAIFILSGLLMMATTFFWIPRLKDSRKIKKKGCLKEIEKMIQKEGLATISEEFHQILSIGKYLKFK